MKKTTVKWSSGSYPVLFKKSLFSEAYGLIRRISNDRLYFLIDENVFRAHKEKIKEVLHHSNKPGYFIVPSGETSKSYQMLNRIHKDLIDNHYSRDTIIAAIGGGVTGDLAGFASSTYMRGVKLVHIPTTIIAAADSSIGGKTGINFNDVKNIIGSFHHPEMVLIDPLFFETLPDLVYKAGMGEIIKYAFLSDKGMFADLLKNFNRLALRDYSYLGKVIHQCIRFKAAVVKQDENERGLRKILNFGHTFAHGFESASGFKIPHGLAVLSGIISALHLSVRMGFLDKANLQHLLELPLKVKSAAMIKKLEPESVYRFLRNDKKNTGDQINFILLAEPGKLFIDVRAGKKEIVSSIKDFQLLI